MKRTIDICGSAIALVLLSPLLLYCYARVFKEFGHPAIFRQRRTGLNGQIFELTKFRSMSEAVDSDGKILSDADRLTNFGIKLRASSVDELPTLWNVLKGDMSLVGPRPLLPEYLELYSEKQARRHEVKPGVTGWTQISGRNSLSWDEKFELDVWYVDNFSLWLDIKIVAGTIKQIYIKRGISAEGDATMPRFKGTND